MQTRNHKKQEGSFTTKSDVKEHLKKLKGQEQCIRSQLWTFRDKTAL